MDITEKIQNLIKESLQKEQMPLKDVVVEMPNNRQNGDYSSNIAMTLASELKENPVNIAERIVKSIPEDLDIEKIEIAKPGFINIHLSNRYLLKEATKLVEKKEDYFELENKVGKKVVIEYTDANPFKDFHIGHLYSNAVGESFARLQEALGAHVTRACYQGDVGLHVAKTLWGLEQKLVEDKISFSDLESQTLSKRVEYIGQAYAYGELYYTEKEDPQATKEIEDINYYIFSLSLDGIEKKDHSKYEGTGLSEKYSKCRQWCLDLFETIYQKVGTEFDNYFFESEVGQLGLDIVKENIGKIFEEDEGSVIYRGDEKKNLHTRVFINKHGLPTYEAKEIGLSITKSKLLNFDESIVITAEEQSGYFRVVLDALGKIDPSVATKMRHIPHGKVRLPGSSKMSSRTGKVLTGEWLIEETKKRVLTLMEEREDASSVPSDELAEKIAIGAIKYAFLKVSVGRDIVFDFEKSITFDGDTGPYLMYVYTRCNSILEEAGFVPGKTLCIESCLANPFVKDLFSHISKARLYMLTSAENYSPSTLCQYLFDLGQKFNSLYQNIRILDAENEERQILLLLVNATMLVMKNGLEILGIPIVQRM